MKNFTPELNQNQNVKEQEMNTKVPWYKTLVGLFISPTETFTNLFSDEKPKGMGLAIIGTMILGVGHSVISALNPANRELVAQIQRAAGMSEEIIEQGNQVPSAIGLISGGIGAAIGVLIVTLIAALFLKIGTKIIRGQGTFKGLYITSLLASVVQWGILTVDATIGYLAKVSGEVLGIGVFFDAQQLATNPVLGGVIRLFSISNIWGIIVLIMGYKVINKITTKKSAIVVIIMQLIFMGIFTGIAVGINAWALSMVN